MKLQYLGLNNSCLLYTESVNSGLDWTGLDWTGLDWTGLDLDLPFTSKCLAIHSNLPGMSTLTVYIREQGYSITHLAHTTLAFVLYKQFISS